MFKLFDQQSDLRKLPFHHVQVGNPSKIPWIDSRLLWLPNSQFKACPSRVRSMSVGNLREFSAQPAVLGRTKQTVAAAGHLVALANYPDLSPYWVGSGLLLPAPTTPTGCGRLLRIWTTSRRCENWALRPTKFHLVKLLWHRERIHSTE